jgi:hypothetical protein
MSAFVVSKKHVAALANFAVSHKVWLGSKSAGPGDYESIYKTLAAENVRSVCHRYAADKAENYADFLKPQGKFVVDNPVSIIKLAQCLDYQSCETDDWKDTQACGILKSIINAAINALPGYDAAPWAIA